MSDFLLQKSCKLFSKSKGIKRARKSKLPKLQGKKNCSAFNKLNEETSEKNISQNLEKLHQFNEEISVKISEEVLLKHDEESSHLRIETEEPTVFTDKDFEEFEKEYCDS